MYKSLKISVIFFILAICISGCSIFEGQYQPSASLNSTESSMQNNFEEADKMLEERFDDVASGRTSAGEFASTNTGASDLSKQNINQDSMLKDSNQKQTGPEVIIQENKKYRALLQTEAGDIEISLFVDKTPFTVNNFVYLSKKNFYNNTVFHRVISGFMIQGGDPNGDGTGNPGYRFADEPFEGEYSRGIIAMANSGPDTNGSQFFIMHEDYPLQKDYVIFGKVLSGMDVVDVIALAPVKSGSSGENSTPVKPIKILKVDIIEE